MSKTNDVAAFRGKLKIAAVGCGHGSLDKIYDIASRQCAPRGWTLNDLDFLLIGGDFQAVRNGYDLNCMSVPAKYRTMGDFHKYYSGQSVAPVLTIAIGGNHEASNYFFELYYGGWLAPNIYYLGAASLIRYGPWRISGISGIYHHSDYSKPHIERLPYSYSAIRSIYHVREYDVEKLLRVTGQVDVAMSHDWPMWIELLGDCDALYKSKPHFFDSAKKDALGNKPATELLNHLRPSYWFSGHMHCRFEATVRHNGARFEDAVREVGVSQSVRNALPFFRRRFSLPDPKPGVEVDGQDKTEFLALSKPEMSETAAISVKELDLPIPNDAELYTEKTKDGKYRLHYDPEWLAITRAYVDRLRVQNTETLVTPPIRSKKPPTSSSIAKHKAWVNDNISAKGLLAIPSNFVRHAPVHTVASESSRDLPPEYPNEQTRAFTKLVDIPNSFELSTNDFQDDDAGIVFE